MASKSDEQDKLPAKSVNPDHVTDIEEAMSTVILYDKDGNRVDLEDVVPDPDWIAHMKDPDAPITVTDGGTSDGSGLTSE